MTSKERYVYIKGTLTHIVCKLWALLSVPGAVVESPSWRLVEVTCTAASPPKGHHCTEPIPSMPEQCTGHTCSSEPSQGSPRMEPVTSLSKTATIPASGVSKSVSSPEPMRHGWVVPTTTVQGNTFGLSPSYPVGAPCRTLTLSCLPRWLIETTTYSSDCALNSPDGFNNQCIVRYVSTGTTDIILLRFLVLGWWTINTLLLWIVQSLRLCTKEFACSLYIAGWMTVTDIHNKGAHLHKILSSAEWGMWQPHTCMHSKGVYVMFTFVIGYCLAHKLPGGGLYSLWVGNH